MRFIAYTDRRRLCKGVTEIFYQQELTGATMKHGCKHITAILIILLYCLNLQAQVSVRANIDRNKILIGEPITLSVEAYLPLGAPVQWINTDTIPHFEVTNRSPVDTTESIDGKKISQVLTITSFDSGHWQMPAFEVIVGGKPYYSDSLAIDVTFTSFDPNEDYRDIKEIIEVENSSSAYIPWIIAAVALVALIVLFYLWRKRKKIAPAVSKPVPKISPYDEAMSALRDLGKKRIESRRGEDILYADE